MNIHDAKSLVNEIFETVNLPPVPVKINNRFCKILGRATFEDDGRPISIELSGKLMKMATDEQIEETIRHEVAHLIDSTIRGYSNHDSHWKEIALSIGCTETTAISKSPKITHRYNICCSKCKKVVAKRHILRNDFIMKYRSICCDSNLYSIDTQK